MWSETEDKAGEQVVPKGCRDNCDGAKVDHDDTGIGMEVEVSVDRGVSSSEVTSMITGQLLHLMSL